MDGGYRIDCDVHPAVGGTRTTLLPYLDEHWKEQVLSRGIDGLDLTSYPPNMPLSCRPDWRLGLGSKPGSDLAALQRHVMQELGCTHAICNVLYGAQAVYDPYMALAFCRAINDWMAAEWLAQDNRLRASIVVPMQAPDLALEEIDDGPMIIGSYPYSYWHKAKPCSDDDITGPSMRLPSAID